MFGALGRGIYISGQGRVWVWVGRRWAGEGGRGGGAVQAVRLAGDGPPKAPRQYIQRAAMWLLSGLRTRDGSLNRECVWVWLKRKNVYQLCAGWIFLLSVTTHTPNREPRYLYLGERLTQNPTRDLVFILSYLNLLRLSLRL